MELNDLVTLERGHLSWFRYPTHNIGTYLGRGVSPITRINLKRIVIYIYAKTEGKYLKDLWGLKL